MQPNLPKVFGMPSLRHSNVLRCQWCNNKGGEISKGGAFCDWTELSSSVNRCKSVWAQVVCIGCIDVCGWRCLGRWLREDDCPGPCCCPPASIWFGLAPPPLLLGPSEPIQRRHSSGHNSEVHKHPPAPLIEIVGVPRTGHLEYKKLLW